MKVCFFQDGHPYGALPGGLPTAAVEIPSTWKRPAAVAGAAVLAALLHGALYLWYASRPAPRPVTAAAPLPMIDMVLAAPPAPAARPVAVPPPEPPRQTERPKPEPPKKPRLKPKPVAKDTAVKRAEPRRDEPEAAPAAPPAPPAPPRQQAAAPRSEAFIPASSNAGYLNNPAPVYPSVARSRHWEGLVLLRVYVTGDGRCGQVAVQRSSGHEVLDEAALSAVRKWRFVPARRGDVAEASWVTVPIEFELH
jgi:protein TonB